MLERKKNDDQTCTVNISFIDKVITGKGPLCKSQARQYSKMIVNNC